MMNQQNVNLPSNSLSTRGQIFVYLYFLAESVNTMEDCFKNMSAYSCLYTFCLVRPGAQRLTISSFLTRTQTRTLMGGGSQIMDRYTQSCLAMNASNNSLSAIHRYTFLSRNKCTAVTENVIIRTRTNSRSASNKCEGGATRAPCERIKYLDIASSGSLLIITQGYMNEISGALN